MQRTILALLILIVAIGALSSDAFADTQGTWSIVGSACTPAVATGTNYTNNGGAIATLSGKQVIVYCPILNSAKATSPYTIDMLSKGSTTHGNVTGWLVEVSLSSGAETTVTTIGAATGAGHTSVTDTKVCGLPTLDFDSYYYYVVVELSGNTVGNPDIQTLYGVSLNNTICQ